MPRDHRRLAAIVSADVAGYSLLMGRDEGGTLAALKDHRRALIDPKIAEYGGRIVKTTGDGLLLEFPSVVDALRCAVDVQRGMAERNAAVPPDARIELRIGINVGDIIIDDDDIFGDGVNVAARLQALAEPGGICVSRGVRDQVLDKLSFGFEDLGERSVKNIVRPVEVFRVDLAAPAGAAAARAVLPRRAGGGRRVALVSGALVVAAIVGFGLWTASRTLLGPASVVAYSAQDRRMTFAVLPFQAAADDADGARIATAAFEDTIAIEESNTKWAQVAPRRAVEQALGAHPGSRDIAKALDVHFLLRGNVTRAPPGRALEVLVIDGSSERVLDTRQINVPLEAAAARKRDLEQVLGWLVYRALQTEVERARAKPDDKLDVRDLAFRAFVDWGRLRDENPEAAYRTGMASLNRALALAPEDPLALYVTARLNLCDCIDAWSTNPAEQQAIGEAALDKYLRRDPSSNTAQVLKAELFGYKGRYDEALAILDAVDKREPERADSGLARAYALVKLRRPEDALASLDKARDLQDSGEWHGLAAAAHYQLGRDDAAAREARASLAQLNRQELANRRWGAVALTEIAAEGRLGHSDRAKTALANFNAVFPQVKTVTGMQSWMHPLADLAGYDPLFDGLRRAGVPP